MGSDGERGVQDLDVFEGLGQAAEPQAPAAPPVSPASPAKEPTDDVHAAASPSAAVASLADSTPSLDGMVALGDLLPNPAPAAKASPAERPFSPLLLESVPPPPPARAEAGPAALEETGAPPPGRDALPSLAADVPPPPDSDLETTNALPPVTTKAVRVEGKLDGPWEDDQQATLVFDRSAPNARPADRRSVAPPSVPPSEASTKHLAVAAEGNEPERASLDQIMSSPPPPRVETTAETESFHVPKLPDVAPLVSPQAAIAPPHLEPPTEAKAVLSAPPPPMAPEPPPVVQEDDRSLSGAFARLGQVAEAPRPGAAARPAPPPPPGVPVVPVGAPPAPMPTSAPPTQAAPHAPPGLAPPTQAAPHAPPGLAPPAPAPVAAMPPAPQPPATVRMDMPERAPSPPVTKPSVAAPSGASVHVHPSGAPPHVESSRVPAAPPSPYGAPPSPYGAPPSPYGAAPSPYGPPPSPYGARPSPFGRPPLPGAPPVPLSRSLEATHTIKRDDGRSKVFAVFAVVLAVAAGATFFMMARPGALVVNVADNKGAPIPKLTVEIDGAKKCEAAPCTIAEIEPGPHKVKVTAPGFEVIAPRDVTVAEKQTATSDFVFTPSKPPPGQGFKVAGSYPGLKVTVDERDLGQVGTETDLDVGPHKIRFSGDRYEPMDKSIVVDPGKLVDFGNLNIKVTKGKATISNETPGAKVYLVDGSTKKEVPQSPMAIEFGPNEKWELVATKEGYVDFKQPISFADGNAEKVIPINLLPKNPKAVPAPAKSADTKPIPEVPPPNEAGPNEGVLKLSSVPPSTVSVDGKTLGATPQNHVSVAPGSHTITFVDADSSLKKTVTLEVKAGETKATFAKLREP